VRHVSGQYSIIAYVFTKISVHLYAAAVVLERVVGWSPLTAAVILVIATGIYTISGGTGRGYLYRSGPDPDSDCRGGRAYGAGFAPGGRIFGVTAALPADFFHMMKPATDGNFPWTGIFFGAPILGIWYWCITIR